MSGIASAIVSSGRRPRSDVAGGAPAPKRVKSDQSASSARDSPQHSQIEATAGSKDLQEIIFIPPPFAFKDHQLQDWWKEVQTSVFRNYGYKVNWRRWMETRDDEARLQLKEEMSKTALERNMFTQDTDGNQIPDLKPLLQEWLQNKITEATSTKVSKVEIIETKMQKGKIPASAKTPKAGAKERASSSDQPRKSAFDGPAPPPDTNVRRNVRPIPQVSIRSQPNFAANVPAEAFGSEPCGTEPPPPPARATRQSEKSSEYVPPGPITPPTMELPILGTNYVNVETSVEYPTDPWEFALFDEIETKNVLPPDAQAPFIRDNHPERNFQLFHFVETQGIQTDVERLCDLLSPVFVCFHFLLIFRNF